MPDRIFRPIHEPPSTIERVLAHPEIAIAALSLVAGAAFALDAVLDVVVSMSIQAAPWQLVLTMGIVMTIGAAAAGTGLLLDHHRRDLMWRLEQAGWALLLGSWGCYAVLGLVGKIVPVAPILGFGLAATAAVRIIALVFIERAAREVMARAEQ